jgi:membrane-associated protein
VTAPLRRDRWRLAVAVLGVALVLLVIALLEGDLPEALSDVTGYLRGQVAGRGPIASFVALYAEESGVPLPVPGDIFVLYLGDAGAGRPPLLLLYWLGVIGAVLLGSSTLYLISRRLGQRLLEGPVGRLIHVTPERLAMAERWFARYGALTIIFGRHVPGLRIPITVAAGLLRVRYRVFVPSVAVSTAIWAGVWIILGARFGSRVVSFLGLHRLTYLLIPLALLLAGGILALRWLRSRSRAPA